MKTLIDMHTHTGFSPDGEGTVEQSLAKAKELGLAAFAITDVRLGGVCSRKHSRPV